MAPSFYDPNSADEQEVPLPSTPLIQLSSNVVLQPPLTRRGTGPGMIAFLPTLVKSPTPQKPKPLDPEPIQKWAEEGFAVVGVTGASTSANVYDALAKGVNALLELKELDVREKFAVYVYDSSILSVVIECIQGDSRLACLVAIVSESLPDPTPSVPSFIHLITTSGQLQTSSSSSITINRYPNASTNFILPHSADYNPGYANLAHSRTLVFLRKILGSPIFDIEAIWEEHTYFEFEMRSVAKTMGTMVAEPYVNHVPTMTGGVGRKNLTAFYRDHFIFANPPDTKLQLVSRTVGSDRVIDEFIFKLTHDRVVHWLLPGVPPTGKKLEIPFVGVVNVRGDRLYHEHIWWDHATALLQAGVLPSHVPHGETGQRLRLPVAGAEGARLLVDETDGTSNVMFGSEWGVQ
ncbi:carboxymethylenebutenolidase [Moniliophthora roreri MCA 2997]|uniref:Carboxymethylenebutenolidase n=2 Tax=Moniliophthora roreri TaxID=221103 RepID=V2XLN9_MONRO|nr:carboxymethylenebutenolidase [Moniliophthora roreri MCA 2997]KAI3596717.1 carboxymethylenebutenolidase [Moniliophthora roreri]